MAELTKRQKEFVVGRLACFDTPTEAADAFKEEFGLEISRSQVAYYDPTKGQKPAEKWRTLFEETRRTYLQDTSQVAVAHQGFRLRELGRIYTKAMEMGNYALAKEALEQAAKEAGGKFTNLQLLDVDPRGALAQLMGVDPDELPEEL